jgi:sugar lactone lactonase YvrE
VSQTITEIRPSWAVPGARVTVVGTDLPRPADGPPHVLVGSDDAHVVSASPSRFQIIVPQSAPGGTTPVRIDELPGQTAYVEIGRVILSGVHQVDSPLFDGEGQLLATESGTRGNRTAAPLFRVGEGGTRDPLKVDIANPTSLALGPDGAIYVSSRFDGHVYRVGADGGTLHASDLGVATGLAFGPDGALYVGDRAGEIMRVAPDRTVETFASLPPSVAAFHLAFGPGGVLYVAAPTLASRDQVYRISPDRLVDVVPAPFGRPQGLAFDSTGTLYVADALAGSAGIYRLDPSSAAPRPELVLTAPALVGLAFDPAGGLVVASNDTLWRVDVPLKPWRG